jgi:hypothetical protein
MKSVLAGRALALLVAPIASAQNSAWIHDPKPVFVPGLYESESRDSHLQKLSKAQVCIALVDFDAILAETTAQYRYAPEFSKWCGAQRDD